jgi:hypothetical protein
VMTAAERELQLPCACRQRYWTAARC